VSCTLIAVKSAKYFTYKTLSLVRRGLTKNFCYCLEACPLKKHQLDPIDFVLNSTCRKTFSTRS